MNGLYDEIRLAIYSVWNRRWLVLAVAWAICLAGWLVLTFIPNSYESKARIFVQSQDLLSSELGAGSSSKRNDMDRLEKTLTSTINLEKVVRQTGLSGLVKTDRDMAVTVEMLRKSIKVAPEKDNLFAVTAELTSANMSDKQAATLSRDIVQKLIDLFQEDNIATDRAGTSNTLRFLDAQIEERQKTMAEAEQKRIAFETQNLGILPGAQSASNRSQSARTELGQIESQLIQAQSSLAALNGQIAGTPATISTFIPGVSGSTMQSPAQTQLAQARGDLAAMRSRGLTDSHPDVIAQQRQVSYLQQQANASPGTRNNGTADRTMQSPNPAYSSLISMRSERQAQVAALQARKNSLDAEMAGLTGKLAAEPGVAAEYDKLNREYAVQKEQYDKLMSERERVRLRGDISSETDAVQFRVIDPPSSPLAPSAPNRPLLIFGVLFAGLGAGVFLAFGLSQMQSTYASPIKLEKATGLPVLGSISQMLTPKEASERKRWLKYYYGAAASLVGVFVLLMGIELAQRSAFL
jgi:polysaccharide chain length determinant protein (PEP-CTERM system associated)